MSTCRESASRSPWEENCGGVAASRIVEILLGVCMRQMSLAFGSEWLSTFVASAVSKTVSRGFRCARARQSRRAGVVCIGSTSCVATGCHSWILNSFICKEVQVRGQTVVDHWSLFKNAALPMNMWKGPLSERCKNANKIFFFSLSCSRALLACYHFFFRFLVGSVVSSCSKEK